MASQNETDRDHLVRQMDDALGSKNAPVRMEEGVSLPPLQVGDAAVQRKAAAKGDPTFTLRAQDQLAPVVVEYWCDLARAAGVGEAKVAEARAKAAAMRDWQARNAAKVPD